MLCLALLVAISVNVLSCTYFRRRVPIKKAIAEKRKEKLWLEKLVEEAELRQQEALRDGRVKAFEVSASILLTWHQRRRRPVRAAVGQSSRQFAQTAVHKEGMLWPGFFAIGQSQFEQNRADGGTETCHVGAMPRPFLCTFIGSVLFKLRLVNHVEIWSEHPLHTHGCLRETSDRLTSHS